MQRPYRSLIEDLEASAARLRNDGVRIDALDATIAELKRHTENIEAVEKNIEAVKAEVIEPIRGTLDENKRAGQFSILGFWIGAGSIVLSTIGLAYTVYDKWHASPPQVFATSAAGAPLTGRQPPTNQPANELGSIRRDLTRLSLRLLGPDTEYKPARDEIILPNFEITTVLRAKNSVYAIRVYGVGEYKQAPGLLPYGDLILFLDGREIGPVGRRDIVRVTSGDKDVTSQESVSDRSFRVYEGQEVSILDQYRFKVTRIMRTQSSVMPVADSKEAVILKTLH